MLRFVLASVLLASVALADVQTNYQDPYASPRQSFGVQGNLGLGDFGGLNANANLNLPSPAAAGNNLLMMAIIGLGVISLINTIATIAVPFFTGNDAEDAADPEAAARRMRMLHYVRDNVIEGIQAFAQKYAQ